MFEKMKKFSLPDMFGKKSDERKDVVLPLFFLCFMAAINVPCLMYMLNCRLDKNSYFTWLFWAPLLAGVIVVLLGMKSRLSFENKVFLAVLLLGAAFAVASPVLNGWDEDTHFFKVVAALDGKGLNAADYSYPVSESFYTLKNKRLDYLNVFDSEFAEGWSAETVLSDAQLDGAAQVTYPVWGYLFCMAGVWLGKLFSLSVGEIFLLGRLANLLGFGLMGRYAVKLTPAYKKIFAVFMLIPSTMIVASSISCDSVVYGLIMLIAAYFLKWRSQEKVPLKEYLIWTAMLMLACPLKYPYLALLGLIFLLPKRYFETGKPNLMKSVTVVCTVLLSVLWLVLMSSQFEEFRVNNYNRAEQIRLILQNPLRTLLIFVGSVNTQFPSFIERNFYVSCEGVTAPGIMSVLYLIFVLLILFLNKEEMKFSFREKAWLFTMALAVWLITDLALYLSFSSAGSLVPSGVQGRYLTPTLFLLAMAAGGKLQAGREITKEKALSYAGIFPALLLMSMCYYFYFE